MISSKLSLVSRSSVLLCQRKLSYVERARLLEKIKTDDSFCRDQLESAQFLLYNKGQPLLRKDSGPGDHQPAWVDFQKTVELNPEAASSSVALSVDESGVPRFGTMLGSQADPMEVEMASKSKFTDLRVGLFLVNSEVAHTLSKGWSLLLWNKNTQFCSKCGKPVLRSLAGAGAKCPECSSVFYPTTSPVGIVSIGDTSTDKLLLIRQPRYPRGMYSCIAGFMDVGETLEDCVKREVAEEVGMEVESVKYKCSQHWPFPAGSVMIGCHAEAKPGQLPDPCQVELEDARWFSREQVREMVDRIDDNPRLRVGRNNDPDHLFVPPKGALAYSLVSDWLEK